MMKRTRITNNIRRLRFEHGEMTQQALADRIGVSRQTVVAIEGAKYSPSLELAFQIAQAFDTPLHEVFEYQVDAIIGGSG
ncbi:MAG: helix-turn-helix domain-containing protein [Luteitalea sp.]|nr:helix-turn-helix domain-containing protein [Luteitalea sp.]